VPVTVVIPALDEEARIAATIDAAFAAGAAEVIVADGGSRDRTAEIAQAHNARVVSGERMRARQLNRGAEAASHEAIVFLHADTLLPPGACEAVERALGQHHFGGFRIAFIEDTRGLRFTAWMINRRVRMTREPWGDQAQFVRRETFLARGGYREIPIMEDYELARRMKPGAIVDLTVRTSGRRFLRKGLVRTTVVNWLTIFAWHLGADPERLAKRYRR
jgi:rSAM/selenodomain-associated transferase 2